MSIANVLRQLEATTKRLEKEKILKDNDSPLLRKFLLYALDARKVFYLRKLPTITQDTSVTIPFDNELVWYLLDSLADRTVTGHEAIRSYVNVAVHLTPDDLEVLRRVLIKDLRCGVSVSTVNKVFPDLVPEFNVMLSHGYDESRVKYPCIVQPKIDGIRAIAFVQGSEPDDVVFYSRSGKEIESLDSIKPHLVKMFSPGTVVDGEAKALGTFQDSASIITRTKNIKEAEIQFLVFDVYRISDFERQEVDETYLQRVEFLDLCLANGDGAAKKIVQRLPHYIANNAEEVKEYYGKFIAEGHEGAIVKAIKGKYEFKRSHNWMKIKPLETVDLEVIGFEEGEGKNKGKLGAMVVDFEGKNCSVGTGYSDEERDEIWKNPEKYLGALVEISYMERTDDGLMRHNRFIRVRSFKGEKA